MAVSVTNGNNSVIEGSGSRVGVLVAVAVSVGTIVPGVTVSGVEEINGRGGVVACNE